MEQQTAAVNYDPVICCYKSGQIANRVLWPNRPSNDWKNSIDFYNNHSGYSPLQMGLPALL